MGLVLVALVACGGGGAIGPPDGGSASTGVATATPGSVVKAVPRGCHRTRTGEADIQFSFSLIDFGAVGNYAGELDFHVVALSSPTSWTVVTGVPEIVDRPNSGIFHLVVPVGEPLPAELRLHMEADALDGSGQTFDLRPDALLSVPVGACNAG